MPGSQPNFSFKYLRDHMIFKSGAGVAPRESAAVRTAANKSGLRRALRMGTILGAGALMLAPRAALSANYTYNGSASTGTATTTAITAATTLADTITVTTIAGGTVTVSSGEAILTLAESGATLITLGANVSGPAGVVSRSNTGGAVTIQSARGVTVTAASGVAIRGASTGGDGAVDIGGSLGLGGAVSSVGNDAIVGAAEGIGGLTIRTGAGGTVSSTSSHGVNATTDAGTLIVDLGANVSGGDSGVYANSGTGLVTVKTASGVTVNGTNGSGIKVISQGGNINIGSAAGLGGDVTGANGIYASTTLAGTINIRANANVTGTSGDSITTSAATGLTNIIIGIGSTITGSINATSTTGNVTVTNAGAVKGSLVASGTGAFVFNNTGTLALSSSQSNTGFTINNQAAGVLTGTGAFGAVNALADSIIRPGDRTLAVPSSGVPVMGVLRTGNLTLATGAKVEVRADYSGGSDFVAVTGTAALGGATLNILATPNNERTWIAGPKTFTVLTATGAITGTFASVTTEYAFLNATADYTTPNVVTATLERSAVKFADVATTKLQAAVGGALDAFASQSSNALIQKVTTLTRLEAPAALQQLAGAGLNSTHSLAFGASRLVIDTVSTEMGRFTGSAGGGAALSYIEDTRIKTPAFKDVAPKVEPIADGRIWAQMMGGIGNIKANEGSGAPAERASTYGVAAGIDRAFNPNLRIGVALAGGQSTLKVAALSTKSDATWGQAALYVVATDGALYAKTSLTMGYVSNETERTVTAFTTPEKATGEFSSLLYAARIEVGQRFELKPAGVTPFLAFEPSLVAHNAYNEKAATPIALGFSKSTANALPGTLGVKFDAVVDLGEVRVTPSATLAWVHNFANATTISPFFTALPGSTFSVTGVEGDRDLARTELNIEATRYGSLASVFANARADYGQRSNSLRGTGGMMVRF
ncbi:MAG: putative autotransporter [Hyphomicrobiales bacterium]|nr:putative autotransporter [Hyphomicrobiales bacterium]